jgi:outer membrane protein assembly factor BamB
MADRSVAANADATGARYDPDGESFDGDGSRSWEFDTGAEIVAQPAVADGTVYVSSYDGFVALDAATGAERWHEALDEQISTAPPVVVDGTVYAVTYDDLGRAEGHVRAIDAESGRTEWTVDASPGAQSPPVVIGDTLLVPEYRGSLVARDAATGERQWATNVGTRTGDCAVADGTVVVGSGDEVVAVALADGAVQWRADVESEVTAGPVASGDATFVGTADGEVCALDASTGERRWRETVFDERIHDATQHMYGHVDRDALADVRSLAADDDELYVGTFNALFALGLDSGLPMWTAETDSGYVWAQTVHEDRLYAGSSGGTVYAFDGVAGAVESRWTCDADAYPTVAAGSMYVATRDGAVSGYRR